MKQGTMLVEPPPSPWNKGQLFSSASIEWGTPDDFFARLDEEFGGFGLDACASKENARCAKYIDRKQDSLSTEWTGGDSLMVWMNPPWGRQIGLFLRRAYEQSQRHGLTVVCLIPASTDTVYWRDWVWKAEEVRLVTGRLYFVRDDGHTGPATKGAAVVIYRPRWTLDRPSNVTLMAARP